MSQSGQCQDVPVWLGGVLDTDRRRLNIHCGHLSLPRLAVGSLPDCSRQVTCVRQQREENPDRGPSPVNMNPMAETLRGFLSRVQSINGRWEEDPLGKEFQEIKRKAALIRQDSNYSTEDGGRPDNLKKNRYKDILPYDQTRVKLTSEEESDYINANFIKGVDNSCRYIATQGPLSHTVQDFWRMVWQYEVKVIVMACREVEHGKRKCERYWPLDDASSPAVFGPFTVVKVEKFRVNAEVIVRKLRVTFSEESRHISHFQYIAWPDRGIPDSYSCFLEMIQLLPQHQGESQVPICVHCSAGCGRTGVICAVEYIQDLLHRQKVPSDFTIFNLILEMRCQRPSTVQTKEQYEFLYHAVTEMFEMELKTMRCYENLKEDKTPFYEDATSLRTTEQTVTQQRKKPTIRSPLPPDYFPKSGLQNGAEIPSNMSASDTYAVVRKNRAVAQTETWSRTSTAPQYDNLTPSSAHPVPVDQLYSTVAHKFNKVPAQAPGSWSISSASAGGVTTSEGPRVEYSPISVARTVDTNAPSKSNTAKCGQRWQHSESGFTGSTNRIDSSMDDYEDMTSPSKGLEVAGNLGFNRRIGKPKGPRDPPAEWSR